MKALFWIGLAVLVLGLVSLVVPIPRTERDSVEAAGISIGVETTHEEGTHHAHAHRDSGRAGVIPLAVSAAMILGGAGMMIAGQVRNR